MLVIRYVCAVLSMALVSGLNAQELQRNNCVCDPLHFDDHFNNAERIFQGKIVSGQLDVNSESIDFTVEVIARLRGEVDSKIALSTPFTGNCGLNILAGAERVFILGKNDRSVSECDLQVDYSNMDPDYLSAAILLVDSDQSELSSSNDILGRYLVERAFASNIWAVFNLAKKLDPTAPTSFSETKLIFRNLEVFVEQNRVISHVWH